MKTELARVVPRLKRLLPDFRKVRVAVLGDLMLDRYLWGTAHRLSPEADVPIVDFVSQNDRLGGAGNVAANLVALGAKVQVFGVVGGVRTASGKIRDDQAGADFRACMREAKIADKTVFPDRKRITTVKARVIARQQIVRVDYERRESLAPDSEERLFRLLLSSLKSLDVLLISDYGKGLISETFSDRVLNACRKFEVPVFVKPNPRHLFAYRGARAIVCNTTEAESYVTRALPDEESLKEAARALLAHFGAAAVVITRGRKGMSIFEEMSDSYWSIPATSFEVTYARIGQPGIEREASGRQVFDVTGAGDTVLSVLSLAVTAGADVREAAYLANTAAGVVVGKLGTASVSPAELAAALDEIHTK
jgi:D-beta-D-heptose 7-phosphate kinase/D-beta-D-heptose 1-phosphate adenosyltransferase